MNRFRKFIAEYFHRCELCNKNQFLGFVGHVVYFESCSECYKQNATTTEGSVIKIYLCRKCVKLPWSLRILHVTSSSEMTNDNAQRWNKIFDKVHNQREHLAVSLV